MEPDFFSSEAELTRESLPTDALAHGDLAARLVSQMERMGPQSVMSIEGSWGSGKSDLMARMFLEVTSGKRKGVEAFWINPWQYGTSDLLTPLVAKMTKRMSEEKRNEKLIRQAVRTVILAGINFGLKAATGPLAVSLEAITSDKDFNKLVDRLIARDTEDQAPSDPVAGMAAAFCSLVDALVPVDPVEGNGMVFVFVDDIDRCLPDRQVALLEALRFLLSSGARARFVVAMDPFLAREALVAHFNAGIDSERFLDKLFHLRFHLPTLAVKEVEELIAATCRVQMRASDGFGLSPADASRKVIPSGDPITALTDKMFSGRATWRGEAAKVFSMEGLNNARVIGRAVRRLGMFAAASDPQVSEPLEGIFFRWLAISIRWPEARRAFQYLPDNPRPKWNDFLGLVGVVDEKSSAAELLVSLRNLRFKELGNDGAFGAFLRKEFTGGPMDECREVEAMFRSAGI